jgi:hypothetical protein
MRKEERGERKEERGKRKEERGKRKEERTKITKPKPIPHSSFLIPHLKAHSTN